MVISQKISEKIMGNRGSNSVICKSVAVKEQRVDVSWSFNPERLNNLRCTLMDF